ncbi:SGNH/GDSL hydrolase family protein, partial [Escherichia coli]
MTKLFLFAAFIASLFLMSFYHVPKKRKIVFFGDSITEIGAQPGGYIRLMEDILRKEGIDNQYELVGAGVSGNKITDLYLRLDEDV